MFTLLRTLFLSLCCLLVAGIRFDGYRVVSITLRDEAEKQMLLSFADVDSDRAELYFMHDAESATVGAFVEIAVSPALYLRLAGQFAEKNNMTIISENLQANFDANTARQKQFPYVNYETARRNNDFFESYREYDEIIDYLDGLQRQHPTLLAPKQSVGKTHEGRDIYVYVAGNQESNQTKAGVFWQGHQHCREWIAGHSLIFTLDALVTRYGSDEVVTQAMDTTDFHIMPVLNVDGYIHTRTENNMWRKNRLPDPVQTNCIGTDLNRNW